MLTFGVKMENKINFPPQRIDHREGFESGRQAFALWSKGLTAKQNHRQSWRGHLKIDGMGGKAKKLRKLYRLQKGRDAQARWSFVGVGLCIHPPVRQS